ncbi:MAG: ABC transporter permease subunit [Anaerolineae bacterium]|nr:ABC transporter permease subunit [Anaerolineae bacterium]
MNKIKEIIRKEWSEVFKNKIVFVAVAFLPLLFTAIPLFILNGIERSGDMGGAFGETSGIPSDFAAVCSGLSGLDCAQFFIVSQFIMLFLMLPVIIPVTIASYSIVGEKTTRTLEPLLATPITTIELIAGKALAAVIPALVATWGAFLIFSGGSYLITHSSAISEILLSPMWLMAIFLLGPLLSTAAVCAAMMVSSRVNDPRMAEQLSALVIIPIVVLFMGQSFGMIQITQTVIIWFTLILMCIDAALLYFATRLFERETILTRWK